jgi:hypothetical protein
VITVSLTKLMRSSIYFVVEYNRMKITSISSSFSTVLSALLENSAVMGMVDLSTQLKKLLV